MKPTPVQTKQAMNVLRAAIDSQFTIDPSMTHEKFNGRVVEFFDTKFGPKVKLCLVSSKDPSVLRVTATIAVADPYKRKGIWWQLGDMTNYSNYATMLETYGVDKRPSASYDELFDDDVLAFVNALAVKQEMHSTHLKGN